VRSEVRRSLVGLHTMEVDGNKVETQNGTKHLVVIMSVPAEARPKTDSSSLSLYKGWSLPAP